MLCKAGVRDRPWCRELLALAMGGVILGIQLLTSCTGTELFHQEKTSVLQVAVLVPLEEQEEREGGERVSKTTGAPWSQ